jgi:hypothetical protein
MPSSRILISSQTLGSAAASVTFSSIPATYTDLVVRYSTRGSLGNATTRVELRINGTSGGTAYSFTELAGTPVGGATSFRNSNTDRWLAEYSSANNSTANTFGSSETYIPNYTVSASKPVSSFSVAENNNAANGDSFVGVVANLTSITAAITSIALNPDGGNFMIGSSFYLYGIKNS